MTSSLAFALSAALILSLEWTMWHLFRRRVEGLHFPREVDASHFRFFSVARIRICAIVHTIFLLLVSGFSLFFLW